MDNTYAQVVEDFDLAKMRDRLNDALGTGASLTRAELSEIRAFVERAAAVQNAQRAVFENVQNADVRPIPGFSEIAAYKHGARLWYITDRTLPTSAPWKSVIGPFHTSYGAACQYAILWYSRAYS